MTSICEPILAETLKSANAKGYAEFEDALRATYLVATVPDNIWDLVAAIRRELAPRSAHNALPVAHLVIAATAIG